LLHRVDRGQVLHQNGRIGWRLCPPLPFIVHKEKSLVLLDRPAKRGAKLVLPKHVEAWQSQNRFRVDVVVLNVLIEGTVQVIGARLGDNVYNAAERASV